jgi:hypothetical protein
MSDGILAPETGTKRVEGMTKEMMICQEQRMMADKTRKYGLANETRTMAFRAYSSYTAVYIPR